MASPNRRLAAKISDNETLGASAMLMSTHTAPPFYKNGYVLGCETTRDAVIIDPGDEVDEVIAAVQASSLTVRHILLTHSHLDHITGVGRAKAAFQTPVWLHDDDRPLYDAVVQQGMMFGLRVERQPPPDRSYRHGDTVAFGRYLVRIHDTPGHSPDHVAFWHDASRTLFSGDLVIAGGSVMIHATGGGNLAEYLASLERIRALAPARLLPAHGPAIDDPIAVLTRYIEHRMAREAQVLNALRTGRHTVQAIAESIYDGLDPALLPAAHETVRAHLDKLRREGRASVDADRWSVV